MVLENNIFIVGIITLSMLSILGLIYITKMTFSSDCTKITKTEKNISRLTTVLLWIQIAWIIFGAIIQTVFLIKY